MKVLIYVRASTKDQDAERVLEQLIKFSKELSNEYRVYSENISGTRLDRPVLNSLLASAQEDDILLVESIDRLSRLKQSDFEILKAKIRSKGLKLVVLDLPTTHQLNAGTNEITSSIMLVINNLLIDLFATMARLDNDKRKERIKQGLARSGYKPTGKKINQDKHKLVKRYLNDSSLGAEEIAKISEVSLSTVFRIKKQMKALSGEGTAIDEKK